MTIEFLPAIASGVPETFSAILAHAILNKIEQSYDSDTMEVLADGHAAGKGPLTQPLVKAVSSM